MNPVTWTLRVKREARQDMRAVCRHLLDNWFLAGVKGEVSLGGGDPINTAAEVLNITWQTQIVTRDNIQYAASAVLPIRGQLEMLAALYG